MALTQLRSVFPPRPGKVRMQGVPGRRRIITAITMAALVLLFAAVQRIQPLARAR
jgi:hypothetical protein